MGPSADTPSPPPPSVRSFVTSRRSCAMSPSTTRLRCKPLHPVPPSRNPMSCPMDRSSPSEESDSAAQRSSSSPPSSDWSPREHLQLHHELRHRYPKGLVRQYRPVRRNHHVPRHRPPQMLLNARLPRNTT